MLSEKSNYFLTMHYKQRFGTSCLTIARWIFLDLNNLVFLANLVLLEINQSEDDAKVEGRNELQLLPGVVWEETGVPLERN